MVKMIKNKTKEDVDQSGEFISLEWATSIAAEYLALTMEYMKSCMLSDDAVERTKYYDSAIDALGHLVTPTQMVGMLGDEDVLLNQWFGEEMARAVEVVEANPKEEVEED